MLAAVPLQIRCDLSLMFEIVAGVAATNSRKHISAGYGEGPEF